MKKNLIGISGKIGSGKDTIGLIIQYLCSGLEKKDVLFYLEDPSRDQTGLMRKGDWHIKKFAGKLKQITAILSGCTIEDLENQEFKNRVLAPEWETIHETADQELCSFDLAQKFEYKFEELEKNNVDPKVRSQKKDKSLNDAYLQGWRNIGNDKWALMKKIRTPMTYRKLLQVVGTEAMRNNVHDNVWVNALFADYKGSGMLRGKGMVAEQPEIEYPSWIITDTRFPNEAEAVKSRGGIVIRVERNNSGCVSENPKTISQIQSFSHQHPSETALDNYHFDYTVFNDGTMEELIIQVQTILKYEKII